jgi:hypothetical protein
MRKFAFLPVAFLLAAPLAVGYESGDRVTGASADVQASLFGVWHRLNPAPDNPTPEHQVMHLRRQGNTWVGRIDKKPEPTLKFETPPAGDVGTFEGLEIADSDIICLSGFGFSCPDSVVAAVEGTTKFTSADPPFEDVYVFPTQLLVTDEDVLWFTLVLKAIDPAFPNLSCPWFRTFQKALNANPFPLPFNGVDFPAMDCVFQF